MFSSTLILNIIFLRYVIASVEKDHPEMILLPEDLGGRTDERQESEVKEVVSHLLKIAEDLNRDTELEQ